MLLNYISAVSGSSDQVAQHCKSIIHLTNPLLESFGNAKTIRNNNSSRFGKYLEIIFNERCEPVGGQTTKFLLEKTRLAFQAPNERNFHIFYQLTMGAFPDMRQEFALEGPDQFYYLAQSGSPHVDAINDQDDFQQVLAAMQGIGITSDDQWYIFQILAAILHCGNVTFSGGQNDNAVLTNETELSWAAYLFEIDPKFLAHSLTHRLIITGRQSTYEVPQNADQASALRDAMCKAIYERLFGWMVEKVNTAMNGGKQVEARGKAAAPPPVQGRGGARGGGAQQQGGRYQQRGQRFDYEDQQDGYSYNPGSRAVGVLDIYGFEIFEVNGFEQFCINYVNERLQQIFIDLTLRQEQQEYQDEGLEWKQIQYFDNKTVVDLIDSSMPPGIFRILDDTARTVHAMGSSEADAKFMENLWKNCGAHPHLQFGSEEGQQGLVFTIKHYAGPVTYAVEDFVFKNKDNLYVSSIVCVQTSNNRLLKSLFPENVKDDKCMPATSSTKIRKSASLLMKKLSGCTPHYIRCIKPNETKSALTWDNKRCVHQIKYLGLGENIKVKRSGFAYRHYFQNFVARFGVLLDQWPPADANGCMMIAQWVCHQRSPEGVTVTEDEFCCGKSKIFVKSPETIYFLEELLLQKLDPIAYEANVKAFKEVEKLANTNRQGLRGGCSLM